MARPAADGARLRPGDLARLLAPAPGRAQAAARIALTCTLVVLVTCIYRTPEAAISAYVVFFITRPDRASSILMSVAALVLLSFVIGLVMLVAVFSVDSPGLRVACIVLLSAGLLFLTSASKLRPIGAIVAMIVGFALDELGIVPTGEAATRGLLYAWLMVAIPIGVNVAVNLVLGRSPRRLACGRLAQCLRVAAGSLRAPRAGRDALDACLREAVQPVAGWLSLARLEGTLPPAELAALRHAAASTTAILLATDAVTREPCEHLPASFAAPIADTLDEMARLLGQGGYPVDIALAPPPAERLPAAAETAAANLVAAINGYAETPAPDSDAAGNAAGNAAGKATNKAADQTHASAFFLPDAFSNPDHVRYALKTTAAATFCYLLYMQLDWPGIHTCFITCYLVSLGTAAETVEKLTLRLAGCAAGALLGTAALVFAVPALTSVGALMALVFAGTLVSAWIGQGSPRIAYAGFQVAFAFFLCVLQGAAPGFDLTIARDRIIGVMLGNLVVYLVFTRVWPISIAGRIDAALADLAALWEQLAATRHADTRRQQAAAALALQGTIHEDLSLARYEPASIGPAPAWLEQRHQVLDRFGAMAGPLFVLAETSPGDPEIARRLRRASGAAAGDATAAPDAPDAPDVPDARAALLTLIDRRLAESGRAAPRSAAKESPRHAPT
ncbi:FUSC family protein [Cupriavidus basilensis]|uniref:FUSC family protein n=1 Tax=Cupriavidus basilensis TaxID=68895 RepID=UPI0007513846|nr:FUSC family protein [Cupriavidus basilensis]